MRYCPYCRRINPGRPIICHFCGRTWYVRLCPRGHENPYNARFCGECGSLDLTDTVGRKPWLIIALKGLLWLISGLFIYAIITGFLAFLESPQAFSLIIILLLLCIGVWFCLSLLPGPVRKVVSKIVRKILELISMVALWLLKVLWKLLK